MVDLRICSSTEEDVNSRGVGEMMLNENLPATSTTRMNGKLLVDFRSDVDIVVQTRVTHIGRIRLDVYPTHAT